MIAAALMFVAVAQAEPPETQPSTEKKLPLFDNNVVGESVPMHMETFYSPALQCRVDAEASVHIQLMQCKNQRKGWLKI